MVEKTFEGDLMTEETFEVALRRLINFYSVENASNTPDFILAQYLAACLLAFETAVRQRENWYGRDPRPTAGSLAHEEQVDK